MGKRTQRRRPDGKSARTREAERVIVALLGAADSMRRFLGSVVQAEAVTLQQHNVLRILRGAGTRMATMEMCEHMIEKTPGITRFLDRLEERGLIERERCETDRRLVYAQITARGLELLRALDDRVAEADASTIEGLSSEAVEELVAGLDAIRRNTASGP